jgi:hypothetical protein
MARKNRNAAKRKDIVPVEELIAPTPEQLAKGNVSARFVVHVDSWTTAKAHKVSNVLDRWFDEGRAGFEAPARAAIEWCQTRWEARGVIGRQCASYSPASGGGGQAVRDIEMRDELDDMKGLFPARHWNVFENVVRWGYPAGDAGGEFANNDPQAIASARAIVGLIANVIAMRIGC